MLELEPIPGTLDMMQEWTLDGTRVHHRAPCSLTFTHSFTPRGNLVTDPPTGMLLGGGKKTGVNFLLRESGKFYTKVRT